MEGEVFTPYFWGLKSKGSLEFESQKYIVVFRSFKLIVG
jgi:hypothetical protein